MKEGVCVWNLVMWYTCFDVQRERPHCKCSMLLFILKFEMWKLKRCGENGNVQMWMFETKIWFELFQMLFLQNTWPLVELPVVRVCVGIAWCLVLCSGMNFYWCGWSSNADYFSGVSPDQIGISSSEQSYQEVKIKMLVLFYDGWNLLALRWRLRYQVSAVVMPMLMSEGNFIIVGVEWETLT